MLTVFPSSPYAELMLIDADEQRTIEPEASVIVEEYDEPGHYARLVTEPLPLGYGNTLGNALKRVLSRNVPGSAISALEIKGLSEGDETVPGADDTVLDVILNTRRIVVDSSSEEPQKAVLNASGVTRVCAKDIACPEGVRIVNPDTYLMTLSSKESSVCVEFEISRGTGYKLRGNRIGEDGRVLVDSVYTPVRKTNLIIEPTRVGRRTDFEKLSIEVWTDGSVDPVESVTIAGRILRDSFLRISKSGNDGSANGLGPATLIMPELYSVDVTSLPLSSRTINALKRNGVHFVGNVLEMSPESLLSIRNFGVKSIHELFVILNTSGYMPEEHPFREHIGKE